MQTNKTEELLNRCQRCIDYPNDCGIYVSLALLQKECKAFKSKSMLKYLYSSVTFQEVPDEISLCISISNCPFKCKGCHSPELWENDGTHLGYVELGKLIENNPGITCVCFMGGDNDLSSLFDLLQLVKEKYKLKTCVYSGRTDVLPVYMLQYLDYMKIGPYIESLGGLSSPNTNQKFYKIINGTLVDLTNKFIKE